MRITIESTTKVVDIDGVPARIWEGQTESGIEIHCYVTRVAAEASQDLAQFEAELAACRPPRNADIGAIPMRLLL